LFSASSWAFCGLAMTDEQQQEYEEWLNRLRQVAHEGTE
jgi:hypothetical protein